MDQAAAENHLEVLKWLHSNRKEGCTANAIDYAAATGNLEIAKWLHTNCCKGCTLEAFTLAAKYDNVEVLKWLYRTQPREAARTPRFELAMIANMSSVIRPCPRVVKWFYESGEPMSGIVENAAQNEGSLELIQCVVKRCPSKNTPKAVRIAAQHKNVVCMRWMLEQFSELSADSTLSSSFKGDRERFAGTQRVIGEAVQGGKKNVVQWLRQHVDYEDRCTWASVGRTRARDEDMPQGMQMLLALGKRGRFM